MKPTVDSNIPKNDHCTLFLVEVRAAYIYRPNVWKVGQKYLSSDNRKPCATTRRKVRLMADIDVEPRMTAVR